MMLDYLQENTIAQRIRKAIADVIADGHVRTYDMLKLTGSSDVVKQGAASTKEMTDAIIGRME